MKKVVSWLIGTTKVGKAVSKVQDALDGWKAYLGGVALIVPGVCGLLIKFQENGIGGVLDMTNTDEYKMIVAGWTIMATRAAIAKTQRATEVAAGKATEAAGG